MYNPVQESLENCRFLMSQVMDIDAIPDGKLKMVVFGFLATILSPLFAFVYVTYGIFKCVSMLVPLICLLIMLAIGLPLLTISKFVYGIYCAMCEVLMYFYKAACIGHLNSIEHRHRL